MKTLKIILKIFLFTSLLLTLLLTNSAVAIYAQGFPAPFDRIKEVAMAQGKKDDGGIFMWEKHVEEVEYWMVYSSSDESVACGQRTGSGSYGWGIAYGLKGEFQFIEAVMGQVVNFLVIEEVNAIEIANQFFNELEAVAGSPAEFPEKEKWVKI